MECDFLAVNDIKSCQIVCGADKASSLKANLGAMTGLESTQTFQENALKSTEIALNSVQRKESSSRLRWTALCINAARLGEVSFYSHLPSEKTHFLMHF